MYLDVFYTKKITIWPSNVNFCELLRRRGRMKNHGKYINVHFRLIRTWSIVSLTYNALSTSLPATSRPKIVWQGEGGGYVLSCELIVDVCYKCPQTNMSWGNHAQIKVTHRNVSQTCIHTTTHTHIYIYINVWKSRQRMNLRDVGSETSNNDSMQTKMINKRLKCSTTTYKKDARI
jgi:hypothetical protein